MTVKNLEESTAFYQKTVWFWGKRKPSRHEFADSEEIIEKHESLGVSQCCVARCSVKESRHSPLIYIEDPRG